jgi:hypothetical protein
MPFDPSQEGNKPEVDLEEKAQYFKTDRFQTPRRKTRDFYECQADLNQVANKVLQTFYLATTGHDAPLLIKSSNIYKFPAIAGHRYL